MQHRADYKTVSDEVVLQAILAQLDPQQILFLSDLLDQAKKIGHGVVSITVKDGKARFISLENSFDFLSKDT